MSDRKFEYTIDADEMAASGVRTVDLVEVDGVRVVEVQGGYQGRMMNIPTNGFPPADLVKSYEYYPAALKDPVVALAYKYGHLDARHAAAEIANEADARIAELETELKLARETIADLRDANERAFKIQAEEANKKLAEVEARLVEADKEYHALSVKQDEGRRLLREAEARAEAAECAAAVAKVLLEEDRTERERVLVKENVRLIAVEADAGRLRTALQKVEAYMASEESPLYSLWENGDICAYDDNPCDKWAEVVMELRNFSIDPAILGYGTKWVAVDIYREILAALAAEQANDEKGEANG